jgi:hypothetical protein
VTSSDGSHLYVADSQTGANSATGKAGGILTLPATAGNGTQAPTIVPGTEGRAPRGLDVVDQAGADVVYFTGTDPANGSPGLFHVPAAGGDVATVAEGAPFVAPDSVVLTTSGVAYVTDQGSGKGQGQVWAVSKSGVTSVLNGLDLGTPAGVALEGADTTLLVSSIDPASRSDQVLFADLGTGRTAAATKVIGANKDSSGGLHRAHKTPTLAWAGVSRGGPVYRVEP